MNCDPKSEGKSNKFRVSKLMLRYFFLYIEFKVSRIEREKIQCNKQFD